MEPFLAFLYQVVFGCFLFVACSYALYSTGEGLCACHEVVDRTTLLGVFYKLTDGCLVAWAAYYHLHLYIRRIEWGILKTLAAAAWVQFCGERYLQGVERYLIARCRALCHVSEA